MSLKNIYKLDVVQKRCFSLSSVDRGKRNFTKFILYNRGTKMFQKMQAENPHPDLPRYRKYAKYCLISLYTHL